MYIYIGSPPRRSISHTPNKTLHYFARTHIILYIYTCTYIIAMLCVLYDVRFFSLGLGHSAHNNIPIPFSSTNDNYYYCCDGNTSSRYTTTDCSARIIHIIILRFRCVCALETISKACNQCIV